MLLRFYAIVFYIQEESPRYLLYNTNNGKKIFPLTLSLSLQGEREIVKKNFFGLLFLDLRRAVHLKIELIY